MIRLESGRVNKHEAKIFTSKIQGNDEMPC